MTFTRSSSVSVLPVWLLSISCAAETPADTTVDTPDAVAAPDITEDVAPEVPEVLEEVV